MNFRNVSDFLNKNELMNLKFVLNTFFYIKKKRQELAINQTYIKITNFKLKKTYKKYNLQTSASDTITEKNDVFAWSGMIPHLRHTM